MTLKLNKIFILESNKKYYTKQELYLLKMNYKFLDDMATKLSLYLIDNETSEYEVCYANSPEVRGEFKTTFTKTDVINYISYCLKKDCFKIDVDKVSFPENSITFLEKNNKSSTE